MLIVQYHKVPKRYYSERIIVHACRSLRIVSARFESSRRSNHVRVVVSSVFTRTLPARVSTIIYLFARLPLLEQVQVHIY